MRDASAHNLHPAVPHEPTVPAALDAHPLVLEQNLPGAARRGRGIGGVKDGNGISPPSAVEFGRRGGLASAAKHRAARAEGLAFARAWRLRMKPYFDALYGPDVGLRGDKRQQGLRFARAWRDRPRAGVAPWLER
jgi:hypothetical protein